jgi:hypothetical protein
MYTNNNDQFEFFNLFLGICFLTLIAIAFVISVPFIIYLKVTGLFSVKREPLLKETKTSIVQGK